MPAALPYMPFYIGDYLADTVHLSTLEHGAYFLLLLHYWKKGEALPNDPERLRKIAGLSRAAWGKISINISEFFEQTETHWIHKRVEEELERARLKSLKSQAAGRKSGEARKPLPVNVRSTDATPKLNHSDSDSEEEKNKSSSSLRSEEPRADEAVALPPLPKRKRRPVGAVYCDDPKLLKAFDAFWEIYPRKKERQFALETWVREIRPEFVPDVIQAAIRYAEIRRGEPEQFTRHAATWLNKGRWRDSLTDEKPKPGVNGNGFKTRSERNLENLAGIAERFGFGDQNSADGACYLESDHLLGPGDPGPARTGRDGPGVAGSDRSPYDPHRTAQ